MRGDNSAAPASSAHQYLHSIERENEKMRPILEIYIGAPRSEWHEGGNADIEGEATEATGRPAVILC